MKIAREGVVFIVGFLSPALVFAFFGLWILFGLFLLLGFFFGFFFRDPARTIPRNAKAILSPADGRIVGIQTVDSHPSFQSPVTVISIFLSLFDVHITRAPFSGTVKRIDVKSGKFYKAYKAEASQKNASSSILVSGDRLNILIKQIVGFAARRIKCFIKEKERIDKGQKIGLICFGSRVELYLPQGVEIKASLGQKVRAGETEIAEIKNDTH
jgi:phosphatidylserine decarboxylase